MVKLIKILLLLTLLISPSALATKIALVQQSGLVVSGENNTHFETGYNGSAILFVKDIAAIKLGGSTIMDTKQTLRIEKGQISVETKTPTGIKLMLSETHAVKLYGYSIVVSNPDSTAICLTENSSFESGRLKLIGSADSFDCFAMTEDGWHSVQILKDTQKHYLQLADNKVVDIDVDIFPSKLPELKAKLKRKSGGPQKVDDDQAESSSGSSSVCLDSDGGTGAGDIDGGGTDIEVNTGKSKVTVKIEIGK